MNANKQAYIFDFDGVLVDTMEAHFACYKQALAEAGVPIDKNQFYYQAGMTGREQIRYFAEKAGVKVDVEKVYARNQELKPFYADRIASIESNIELLRTLRAAGHPVAIATGSTDRSIRPIMARFNIEVDAVATADNIQRGKPHPDLFLKAAERLGVDPQRCTVIEDAEVGIQAARAAGMSALHFVRKTLDSPEEQ
jgi:beta-phosphoglucomutase family hydrolase